MPHPIINLQTYLKDLIDYALLHIKNVAAGDDQPLAIQDLETLFHQPFGALLEPRYSEFAAPNQY